jgi:hypothetical protein
VGRGQLSLGSANPAAVSLALSLAPCAKDVDNPGQFFAIILTRTLYGSGSGDWLQGRMRGGADDYNPGCPVGDDVGADAERGLARLSALARGNRDQGVRHRV